MKTLDVVLGLQWGDEGKGKIVDVLAERYPVVARFQGGPNAGHSIHFGNTSFVLHSVPSGVFRDGSINIIGNGVVLDPTIFREECQAIEALGVPVRERVKIARRAHLIVPTHKLLDAADEAALGKSKIGSTLKGIGPAYSDKTGAEYLKTFDIIDAEYETNALLAADKAILAEGAQGSMLDVDFGSYPFVTSSSTACAGACTGLGVAPGHIGKVYGVFKAYCTRVGSGPFPTELGDETGERMRQRGREFGATTGRPRRTGWLDIPALKFAVMISGVTDLIMMKADVLDGFDTVKVCCEYRVDGVRTDRVPYDVYAEVEPVYKTFPGWKGDLGACRSEAELPAEFKDYIAYIEQAVGVPIRILSLGPDRDQTLIRG